MKCGRQLLALAFLHLAFSLLLCFGACPDARRHGNGRNSNQKERKLVRVLDRRRELNRLT